MRHSTRRPTLKKHIEELRLPAMRILQGDSVIYVFACDGKVVGQFTTISRISQRDGCIRGYQRIEVATHIDRIREYIDSPGSILPNAVVIAFDSRVRFEARVRQCSVPYITHGEMVIPIQPGQAEEDRPGFIVDGQQRLAAIRAAERACFPVIVGAFIADDQAVHAGQFVAVNSAKPLPASLIVELLPKASLSLPSHLARRKLPAELMIRLNTDPASPLYRLIKTATQPSQFKKKDPYEGLIKDTALLGAIEHSLSDGLLFAVKEDIESMYRLLCAYWRAVAGVFSKKGWGLPPRVSRLMHGAGIATMGLLMDEIGHELAVNRGLAPAMMTTATFEQELRLVAEDCRWTEGLWELRPTEARAWNGIQNTNQDKAWLADRLTRLYRDRARKEGARIASG